MKHKWNGEGDWVDMKLNWNFRGVFNVSCVANDPAVKNITF